MGGGGGGEGPPVSLLPGLILQRIHACSLCPAWCFHLPACLAHLVHCSRNMLENLQPKVCDI